jgi:lipid-binding SYLF domain-containing protein
MSTAKPPVVPQEAFEDLQNNLRWADGNPNTQLAAVFSLSYVRGFLANFGIEAAALKRLENALLYVVDGHEHRLLKPRRSTKPRRI